MSVAASRSASGPGFTEVDITGIAQLVDLAANALTFFVGLTPDRPLWLRRIVQVCWTLVAALVILAWAYGLVALVRAF